MSAKITPWQYAKAFLKAISDKKITQEKVAENFLALVRKNGDWRKRKEIIEECAKELRRRDGKIFVELESARPLAKKRRERVLEIFHGSKTDVAERINQEAIAGVKITVDGEKQFDGTLKRKLDLIFKNV